MMIDPVIRTVKFMFSAVTGRFGGQRLKNMTIVKYVHANELTNIPQYPGTCHGPHMSRLSAAGSDPLDVLREVMALVQRRYSKRLMATRYEDCKLDTESETRSLNAVDDPRMMSERRQEMVVVTRMDRIGRDVRGFTYFNYGHISIAQNEIDNLGLVNSWVGDLT